MWSEHLEKLVAWVTEQGWEVDLRAGNTDEVNEETMKIKLNSTRSSRETICYTLLHEIGHAILFQQTDYGERFVDVVEAKQKKSYGGNKYRVGRVEEELAAWAVGLDVGKQLGIPVNLSSFNKVKSKAVMTYFKWAARANEFAYTKGPRNSSKASAKTNTDESTV